MRRRCSSLRWHGKRTVYCYIICRKKCKTSHPFKGRRKKGFYAKKHSKLNIQRRYRNTSGKRRKRLGQTGKRGVPGSAGAQGTLALVGMQGETGLTGTQGIPGVAGAYGIPGLPGPGGAQGMPGPTGLPGPAGAQGIPGPTGSPGPSGPTPDISNIEIVPLAERYFYFAPDTIKSSVTIMADQFSVDGVQEVFQRFHVGSSSYANLYINGMIQESTSYSLTPASLTIHLNEGEVILPGTPIIVEIVQFSARYSA